MSTGLLDKRSCQPSFGVNPKDKPFEMVDLQNCESRKKMNRTCNFCGNKNFKENQVQYIYRHNGQFLVVNSVPCEECEFCGERYFRAEVLKKIEKEFNAIYSSGKKVKREVKVPVEEFLEI